MSVMYKVKVDKFDIRWNVSRENYKTFVFENLIDAIECAIQIGRKYAEVNKLNNTDGTSAEIAYGNNSIYLNLFKEKDVWLKVYVDSENYDKFDVSAEFWDTFLKKEVN